MKRRVHTPPPVEESVNGPDRAILEEPHSEVVEVRTEISAVIDDALMRFQGRSLVSGTEVVDFLLDLRGTVECEVQVAHVPATAAR